MKEPFIELRNISKYFARVIANKDVSFTINKGEVLALLGENGAGKSTIMKALYGLYRADEGEFVINNEPCIINSPKDAMSLGIGMIQQHFSLIPAHTVLENIILGNEKGFLDKKILAENISRLSHKYSFNIDPNSYIKDLPVGVQQKVEILKALYQEVELLIMDEPTAVLTPQEAITLMDFVREFVDRGHAVVFITHKLQEVMHIADRIIVMRNGIVLGDILKSETNDKDLSKLMVGKDIPVLKKTKKQFSETTLKVENLTVVGKQGHHALRQISFSIGKGEILGIAGVSGNGQQELGETISGLYTAKEGEIYLEGKAINSLTVKERIDAGIGYVHADRHTAGLVLDMSLSENLLLKTSFHKEWSKYSFIKRKKLNKHAEKIVNDYSIKTSGIDEQMKGLSGGNQQKVVLGREVEIGTKLIIFDQPTRGLDLGAIEYVHRTILEERDKGKCILLISTELSEIFALSDRIGVLYDGKLLRILDKEDANIETIGMLMAGVDENNPNNIDQVITAKHPEKENNTDES
ncbi:MAG: ABC transporter ATP-binding protein [Spirochaetales bacterium]|nr:ABC transporter ATP-binding protein [Spirochaetales bacterium]